MNHSPSRIVVDALRQHVGLDLSIDAALKAEQDTHCGTCGTGIANGESFAWLQPSKKSFTDWQYLAHPVTFNGGVLVCPACSSLFAQGFLRYQANAPAAVYSPQGAWMLTLDAERRWFLLNPPEPPFVAYIALTLGQHVAWRAPVTLDRNLIRVGVGREVLSINRPLLLEASDCCFRLADSIRANMKGADGKLLQLKPNHPFSALLRKMNEPSHGVIRSDIRRWMQTEGMQSEIDFLESLGEGELWGLAILNKANQEEPIKTAIKDKLAAKSQKKNQIILKGNHHE